MADNFKYVAAGEKILSSSVTSTGTTISLTDLNSRDGTALTMTDFGDIGFATLEPGGSNMELVSFTGISSTSLTGVTRGLGFEAPYTTVAALKKAHAAGSTLVFSNSPQFYNELGGKDNDETVTGTWTFTSTALPTLDTYAAPTANAQLAAKKYVDDVAAGGTATIDRLVPAAVAGETIAAGNLVYFDSTTANEWMKCDADTAATVDNVILGIAQGAGTNGAAISGGVLLAGLDSNQTGMTAGNIMYAGNTAGAIASSAGTTEVTVGIAKSATELYFMPRFNQNITEAQQDLLDGITASAAEINKLDGTTITTAQLTEAGTFFGSTDLSAAEAETLSDGSNADSLHVHNDVEVQILTMEGGWRINDIYGDAGNDDGVGGLDSDWTGFADAGGGFDARHDLVSVSADDEIDDGAVLSHNSMSAGGNATVDFDNDFKIAFFAEVGVSGEAQDLFMGLGDDNAANSTTGDVAADATLTNNHVGFFVQDDTLYASNANGATQTKTDISSGLTLTNKNCYSIRYDADTNIKFYVNGTLKATHTTYIPTGATGYRFCLGAESQDTGNLKTITISCPIKMAQKLT